VIKTNILHTKPASTAILLKRQQVYPEALHAMPFNAMVNRLIKHTEPITMSPSSNHLGLLKFSIKYQKLKTPQHML
jgi:hypothetical protein